MRLIRVIAVLVSLAAAAGAQQGKDASARPAKKAAAAPAAARPAAVKQPAAPSDTVNAAATQPEPAEEDGGVMIDARTEENNSGRFTDNEASSDSETEEPAASGGMPASYGQLKGTLSDGGRSLLVFENEDGVLSFVQLSIGKGSVTWKLISRIARSAD